MDIDRILASVPRGFSRLLILRMLKDRPMRGRELILEAEKLSKGVWRPSPGLIYPLLGRLLSEGLIDEGEDGRYRLTEKGEGVLGNLDVVKRSIERQMDFLMSLSVTGRFLIVDAIERMISIANMLWDNIERLSGEQRDRYKRFLEMELRRIEELEAKQKRESVKVEEEGQKRKGKPES